MFFVEFVLCIESVLSTEHFWQAIGHIDVLGHMTSLGLGVNGHF